MANALLINPFPGGTDVSQTVLTLNGSIALAGSAVATGEPINWNTIFEGIGYNEINYRGNGVHGSGTALTTGFAVASGICTVTANNNFQAGQLITFLGNTQTLSEAFNGVTVQVISATATTFTFATTTTGTTTTGDVGLAVNASQYHVPEPTYGAPQALSVTALAASGGVITVTAANNLLPGASVSFTGTYTGTIGPALVLAGPFTVLQSTGTAFTIASSITGTTGVGSATGINPVTPFDVEFHSQLKSGYVYQYDSTTGCLFVMVQGAAAGDALAPLAADPYPAAVLGDVIKFSARFARG